MSYEILSTELSEIDHLEKAVSYWERVPFDILTSILPYLDLENPYVISRLCADPVINSRLQHDNPNGVLWQYLFTRKLSRTLPESLDSTLKDRYYEFIKILNQGSFLS